MRKRVPREVPDPIDCHVGARVRARRIGLRMSQSTLGNGLGVTFQQVQKYESGDNRIGASNLFRTARILGVDVGYFFEGLPPGAGGTPEDPPLNDVAPVPFDGESEGSRESIQLSHDFQRIDDPILRKELFRLVRAIADRQ